MTSYSGFKSNSKKNTRRKKNLAKICFNFLLVVVFIGSLAMYLMQVNAIAAKGYELRGVEDQVKSLKEENKKLELSLIELQSMSALQEKIEALQMVEVDSVNYLKDDSAVVAKR